MNDHDLRGDAAWFVDSRFGMFIHWGLYAMPARHEWVQHIEKKSAAQYQKYFDLFEPDHFAPREWARMARAAGMRYVVITTKHHEGFCLWDSQYSDFTAAKAPACRRDLLREIVDAFRAEGLRIGFYYSLADWHHPECPMDKIQPAYNDPQERSRTRDIVQYQAFLRNQLRELLTNFGRIDIMWFDGNFSYVREPGESHDLWDAANLAAMIRQLQPGILINERLARGLDPAPYTIDIKTPEQQIPATGIRDPDGNLVVWEGCQTLAGSWGYHREEGNWKNTRELVTMLINHVSRGGNMLLNVGPTSRGEFDDRAQLRLAGLAQWMRRHDGAIYGCTVAPIWAKEAENCRYTYNPVRQRLYVHCLTWPFSTLLLPGLAGKLKYAQLLSDRSEITFHESGDDVILALHGTTILSERMRVPRPVMRKPKVGIPVIELILK